MKQTISPYGGALKELFGTNTNALKGQAFDLPEWTLSQRQLCDVELLLCGAFSPLEGFMSQADYAGVVEHMRLADGTLWPMPITLDVSEAFAAGAQPGQRIALRDPEGLLIAFMEVSDRWVPDKAHEARCVLGSEDRAHPAAAYLFETAGAVYLGGRLTGITAPTHYDFKTLRYTPRQLREEFARRGWSRVVAFQTRNPMHRAHLELTFRAAQRVEANLLIHPVVGMTKPGDVDHYTRVRCYEHALRRFPEQTSMLSLLPLAMRMGGPREALWHAIIRRNYGCTHFIVGRDHASPGKDSLGREFYGPYDAHELLAAHRDEIGIEPVPFQAMVYVEERAEYVPVDEVEAGETVKSISGTELRRRLREGIDIPDWFTYPEIAAELRRTHPPRHRQGFTVFFTGLSGAGKSTLANALMVKLMETGGRPVTLLDGDIVRTHLSSELGFSREHRDLNVRRIGFVASEITKNGGVAICAPIAPYAATRRQVREMIEPVGGFVEVHVATPLDVCEERDRKGLYAKARAGLIKGFTGIDDPYESPVDPELRVDTSGLLPEQSIQRVLLKLEAMGFIAKPNG
ncbi:bifunctional sulfate adenylyltransferase/adenylylsulfate kinase [Acidihalobacter ferrooxydans]|uniref:Adenylyl-sulfate kinase n=1 Tax=Acidihalobacter ferrooxydans TaxID=1765967 RepID=A0A1P8ULK0_9GAMM|nr:bifunctional sulfate adenylyltransferase/adenylylsulfate kinase [Acidihalobacter ferrooxydans]APZ44683.1 adenylyltransferase [Acidihalobacter ferrooxydans]